MNYKGSSELIVDPFYMEVEDGFDFYPGQICYTHVLYQDAIPQYLSITNVKSSGDFEFIINEHKPANTPLPKHAPIKEADLQQDEGLYVTKGKFRPVIILGCLKSPVWNKNVKREERIYLCAPIFSFKERHDQRYVIETQAFKKPNLFYLPQLNILENESAVRFELIQPTYYECLDRHRFDKGKYVRLSDDAFIFFANHLSKFLNRTPLNDAYDQYAKDYGDLVLNAFQESLKGTTEKASNPVK